MQDLKETFKHTNRESTLKLLLRQYKLQGQQSKTAGSAEPCEHFLISCHNSKFWRMPFPQSSEKILVLCNGQRKVYFASSCML
jgi:hypothetical protein